jgi:4-diphosphocytidyl-2-C-methyl-D-erythritol kinase
LLSVFQAVSLRDEVQVRPSGDITLRTQPELPFADQTNLVLRAALLLRHLAGVRAGAQLTLHKRIPTAAGLGGGSADAAATLVGLRRLWGLAGFELGPAAEQLGSDVPFFLHTSTALVSGRGEVVQALPPLPARPVVLVRPAVALATRDVFSALSRAEWSDGAATRDVARALATGRHLPEDRLRNSLQAAAERCCPPLARLRTALEASGRKAHLSGSGPVLFLFPHSRAEAHAIAAEARARGADAYFCHTVRYAPLQFRFPASGRQPPG